MRIRRSFRHRRPRVAAALAVVAGLILVGCGAEDAGPKLALSGALPKEAPSDTVLRVGDPATQVALEESGLIDEVGFEIEWANISGGPKTLQAFRAGALDAGAVADIPPLFAQWTGTDIKIVSARTTEDPLEHPVYQLGIAPGADIEDIDDLKGKKIAYSPGQAQGALVLRVLDKAGIGTDEVDLVEMTSVDDSFVNALASNQVDAAPLGAVLYKTYLAKYEKKGASAIPTGIRDDAWTLYVPAKVLEDADKAAALKEYVALQAQAVQWSNEHPEEFAKAYYQEHEGLSPEDATWSMEQRGTYEVPADWDQIIADHQATADLLVKEQDREPLDVEDLYDRRFEKVAIEAVGGER